MREIKFTSQFKKDYKKAEKQGKNIALLEEVIERLANDMPLDAKHRDHALTGTYAGARECHIEPDWLLIYLLRDDVLVLTLVRVGSHSELF